MPIEKINVPLVLSFDQGQIVAFDEATTNGKDQIRLNCDYEATRGAEGAEATVSLVRRHGVAPDAGTYGTGTQVQYLIGSDPGAAWDSFAAWVAVKDSTANNVVTSATSTTVLSDADYVPRFMTTIRLAGTQYALLQLQNTATPAAASNSQKVYYSSAIATWVQISDATFVALQHRGQMEELDGWVFAGDGRDRIYNQATQNDLTSAWTDYITISSTADELQGLARLRRKILALGQETCETFQIPSPGNATGSVLNRINNTVARVGLGDIAGPSSLSGKTHYYTTINDWLFYLGRFGNRSADQSLILFDGASHVKISKAYEDKMLSASPTYGVSRFSYHGKVGVAIQMTAPGAATHKWLTYFPDLNEFFLMSSSKFGPASNGYHYLGINPQKLYTFPSSNAFQDDSATFTMMVQFKVPSKDGEYKEAFNAGVVGDTMATSENITMEFSVDGGKTWSTPRNIDMSKSFKFMRKGVPMHRELMVRIKHTGIQQARLRRYFMDTL